MTPEQSAVIDAAIALVADWINESNSDVSEGDLMDAVSALARAEQDEESRG